jgi:pimeloyl-ACP methyl ester carboxylesterase
LTWAHSEGVEPQPSDLAAVRVGGHGSARPTVTFEAEQGRPAILYGVSYGAEGALLIASYEPHLFDAVVASSPSSEINGAYGGKPGPAWAFHRTALLTNTPPPGGPDPRPAAASPGSLVSTLGVRRRHPFFHLTDYLVAQLQALVAHPRRTGRCHGRDPVAGLPAEAALSGPGLIPHLLDPGDRRAGCSAGCGKYRVHAGHATVADVRARPGDQLLDLLLIFPAERAR